MANVAIVGYSRLNSGESGDIIDWMPQFIEGEKGVHYCYVGVLDCPDSDFYEILGNAANSGADVLHFANYRDQYRKKPLDKIFLENFRTLCPGTPVLLTSASPCAEGIAEKLGISFMHVPFDFDGYVNLLLELSEKRKDAA